MQLLTTKNYWRLFLLFLLKEEELYTKTARYSYRTCIIVNGRC